MLNQWDQDRSAYNETVSLFRFQSELCLFYRGKSMEYNVTDSLWRAFLTWEGYWKTWLCRREVEIHLVEDLPWDVGRNVSEGAESLLQGNLRFKGSQCKQVLVTIRKKCVLDNHCSWCWACSNVYLSELWGTEAQRSEMELLLEVTFKVSATSPGGQ